MEKNLRARVFISCGQKEGTEEVEIAHKIAEKLKDENIGFGFDTYIALEQQDLKDVRKNIFRSLSESEYLIFIDFKREGLYKMKEGCFEDTSEHRGSLFSHQELAIASFLEDIELLAYREKGVKKDDGILKFIQADLIEFTDRHLLPDVVAAKVRERGWDPDWRNELLLERDDEDFQDVRYVGRKERPARYYHIKVKDLHRQKIARDCVAYLERIEELSTGEVKIPELVEFKWKGVTTPRITIPPKKFRYLDAFHIFYDSQNIVHLGINPFLVDFSGYYEIYTLQNPTDCQLTYVVFSENFPPARATFKLRIGKRLDDVEFYIADRHFTRPGNVKQK